MIPPGTICLSTREGVSDGCRTCAVFADSALWGALNFANLPKAYGCANKPTKLWYPGKDLSTIDTYLKTQVNAAFSVSTTVLISLLDGFPFPQLLIPPAIVSSVVPKTLCVPRTDADGQASLAALGQADFNSFHAQGPLVA